VKLDGLLPNFHGYFQVNESGRNLTALISVCVPSLQMVSIDHVHQDELLDRLIEDQLQSDKRSLLNQLIEVIRHKPVDDAAAAVEGVAAKLKTESTLQLIAAISKLYRKLEERKRSAVDAANMEMPHTPPYHPVSTMTSSQSSQEELLDILVADQVVLEKRILLNQLSEDIIRKPLDIAAAAVGEVALKLNTRGSLLTVAAINKLIGKLDDRKRLDCALHEHLQSPPISTYDNDVESEPEERRQSKRARQNVILISSPPMENTFSVAYPNMKSFRKHCDSLAELDSSFAGLRQMTYITATVSGSQLNCKFKFIRRVGGKSKEIELSLLYSIPDTETIDRKPSKSVFDRFSAGQYPFLVVWATKVFETHRLILSPSSEQLHGVEVKFALEVSRAQFEQVALMQNLLLTVQPTLVIDWESGQSDDSQILSATATGRSVHCKRYAYDWECVRNFREDPEYANKLAAAESSEHHRRYDSFGPEAYKYGGGAIINLGEGPKSRRVSLQEFLSSPRDSKGYLLGQHGVDPSITPSVRHPKDKQGLSLPLVNDTPQDVPLLEKVAEQFDQVILIQPQFFLSRGPGSCNLHLDDNCLFFVQLHGSRSFYIYPKQFRACVMRADKENACSSDLAPQLGLFDGYPPMRNIPVMRVDLHPGDLFILDVNDLHAVEFHPDRISNLSCAISWAIHPAKEEIAALAAQATTVYNNCKKFSSPVKEGSRKAQIPLIKSTEPSNYTGGAEEWDIYWSIARQHLDQDSCNRLRAQWDLLNSAS